MEAVKVLDTYKLSLTEDPIYLKVLSVTFLYFKIKEISLLEIIPDLKKRKSVIAELFKAGLLEINLDDNVLSVSKRAEIILDGFDLYSIVIQELIGDLPLNKIDKIFLFKSNDYFIKHNSNKKDLSTLLRTLNILSKALSKDRKYSEIISNNAFYIFYHIHSFNLNLTKDILFEEIKDNILADNLISTATKKGIIKRKEFYIRKMDNCHYMFNLSNSSHKESFSFYDIENKNDKDDINFLTGLRHINHFYHGYWDSELFNISYQLEDSIPPFNKFKSEMPFEVVDKLISYFKNAKIDFFNKLSIKVLIHYYLNLKENNETENEKNTFSIASISEKIEKK